MIDQSASNDVTSALNAHFHSSAGTCPSCGQDIPADRIQEISGRIAARDREQTIALTARLEDRFLAEKTQAEADAKADIEFEKRQSAEREARAIQKAKSEAETLLNTKLAEAERVRQESISAERLRLDEAVTARRMAEEQTSSLQGQMRQQQEANLAAIQALRAESILREASIRVQAKQSAEAAATDRLAALEAAHRDSDAALQSRLLEAETAKTAAQQNEIGLSARLDALEKSKATEIAELKATAAAEAEGIRVEAEKRVTGQFNALLAEKDKAVASAAAKASQAEQDLKALVQQHEHTLTERLNSQRGVLEKAMDEAVNTERARAFEENQKLTGKVNDLQRALEKKTNEELGEGAEINLFESLTKAFPGDKIDRIPKGEPGADILHVVMLRGQACGAIVYDSKNHKGFRSEHVSKLRADQLAAKAEHAILSLHKFPEGTRQLHVRDGVLLANPARVVMLATILRQHIAHVHTLRLSAFEREMKTSALYDFINSEQYTHLVQRVDERTSDLLREQEKEIKWHENHWRREGETLRAIQKARADLDNAIAGIVGVAERDGALAEAS